MSFLPCSSARVPSGGVRKYHRAHTCRVPEIDYKTQDDHRERREVEPVRVEVLWRSRVKSAMANDEWNVQRGKGLWYKSGMYSVVN